MVQKLMAFTKIYPTADHISPLVRVRIPKCLYQTLFFLCIYWIFTQHRICNIEHKSC